MDSRNVKSKLQCIYYCANIYLWKYCITEAKYDADMTSYSGTKRRKYSEEIINEILNLCNIYSLFHHVQ
jgi:hypothetical protein